MQSADIPDKISDVKDEITKEVIACGECKRAYRIVAAELAFLRRMNIPVPHLCPDCRFQERRKLRTPYEWHQRECDCNGLAAKKGEYKNLSKHEHNGKPCKNNFESPYALTRPEIVYCDTCFNSEMV